MNTPTMPNEYPESLVGRDDIRLLVEMAAETPPGIFLEVGVYKGGTAYRLYLMGRELYLYDTFSGIPERTKGIDQHLEGDFSDTDLETVKAWMPKAKFFPGIFPDTLEEPLPPVAFAHIDCDNYKSIKACIERISPYMVDGGIMYFDDYGSLKSADMAVDELLPGREVMRNGKAFYRFGGAA